MRAKPSPFSLRHQVARAAWNLTYLLLIRFSPRPCHGWRSLVLRAWGARVGRRCHIYPRVRVWAPWNLECGDEACVGDDAEIYNVAPVTLGVRAVVSQGAYLCTASHDYREPGFPLISAPIRVEAEAWVAARAMVLPGVTVHAGSVVGAGSVVTRDVPPRTVGAGNPFRVIRSLADESSG
jgi:putative colanic acid biosynthesis acetyltransferase WcaF